MISCFESVWMGFSEWLAIIHYSESRVVVKLGLITFGKKLFPGESEAEGLGGMVKVFSFGLSQNLASVKGFLHMAN